MERFQFKDFFARKNVEEKKERRAKPRVPVNGMYSVLIVDDSKTVLHALQVILEQGGYKTLTAMEGDTALDVARTHKPDVVLMDVVMPGMNGFQATRAISKDPSTQDIPVVLISGSEQLTEKAWGMRLGAKGFLAKPIQRGPLFTTIESLLGLNAVALA